MSDNSQVLDLDVLTPQPRKIKFGDQEIEIKPPKTVNVLRLGFLGQKMQEPEKLTKDELDTLVNDLTSEVKACVPELADKELSTSQLMALIGLIVEMGMPAESEELKKKGITVESSKKVP
jgi:hypothetical protein